MNIKPKPVSLKRLLIFPVLAMLAIVTMAAVPPYIRNVLTTNEVTLGSGLSISALDVLSATGGAGTPAGNSAAIQFNEGGAFAGTNKFVYDRTNNTMGIGTNMPQAHIHIHSTTTPLRLTDPTDFSDAFYRARGWFNYEGDELFNLEFGASGIGFGFTSNRVSALVSNAVDSGVWTLPWRSNYAKHFFAFETISAPQLSASSSGVLTTNQTVYGTLTVNSNLSVVGPTNGRIGLSDTNGTTNVVINAEGYGRIGLGTNNPGWALHVRTGDTNDVARFETAAGTIIRVQTNVTTFLQPISAPTNTASFTITTNDFVSGQLYTNVAQRASVTATISLTNILSTDFARMSLWVDQDADGSFEMQGRNVSVGGVALVAATEVLWARLQPGARFSFTNQSGGTAVASVVANSSDWTKE